MFIMEGDTPAFLGLIGNGLNAFRNPSWGGWGGRCVYRTPYGESHAIWTQGGNMFRRVSSRDRVIGKDGRNHLYRWFHYQEAGFIADAGMAALHLSATVGSSITVTPTAACRPDWLPLLPCKGGVAHVILAVTDDGTPTLTSYRRIIIEVPPPQAPRPQPGLLP